MFDSGFSLFDSEAKARCLIGPSLKEVRRNIRFFGAFDDMLQVINRLFRCFEERERRRRRRDNRDKFPH